MKLVTYLLSLDMKANNYEVADAGETITFKGVVKRSLSQAFFLVFVTAMSMVTLALVLNIQFNDLGTWRLPCVLLRSAIIF